VQREEPVFGSKMEGGTKGQRTFHNEGIHIYIFFTYGDLIEKKEMGGGCIHDGDKQCINIVAENAKRKKPLGRNRCR
jgi:hypothetical protein